MPRMALEHEALPRFLEPMLLRAGRPRVHIEAAPSRHAVAAGFFLYSFEPGQPHRGHHRRLLRLMSRTLSR